MKTKFLAKSTLLIFVLFITSLTACKKESDIKDESLTNYEAGLKPANKLDAPTLSCGDATEFSIDIVVTAGASGAPAGFSLQWKKKSEFDVNGWAQTGSYCAASFSGVPGCSNYALGANGSITVSIGDLFDECGVSGGCGDLECETEYVFRAFAHNVPGGANKSDFSATLNFCETLPCLGCTYTQGYWKTHGPEGCNTGNNSNEWPQDVLDNGLIIGGINLSANDLCANLQTPAQGTNRALAHQLIAALLNEANGVDISSVQTCIDDAQAWLLANGINGTNTNNALTECLADFNEGASGVNHCD